MSKGYNNQIVQTDGQPGTIWHGAERPEQAGISAGPADQMDLSLLCFPLVRRTEQDTQQVCHELFCQDALAEKCNTTVRIPLIWLSLNMVESSYFMQQNWKVRFLSFWPTQDADQSFGQWADQMCYIRQELKILAWALRPEARELKTTTTMTFVKQPHFCRGEVDTVIWFFSFGLWKLYQHAGIFCHIWSWLCHPRKLSWENKYSNKAHLWELIIISCNSGNNTMLVHIASALME